MVAASRTSLYRPKSIDIDIETCRQPDRDGAADEGIVKPASGLPCRGHHERGGPERAVAEIRPRTAGCDSRSSTSGQPGARHMHARESACRESGPGRRDAAMPEIESKGRVK
jgi:hypothetical protein